MRTLTLLFLFVPLMLGQNSDWDLLLKGGHVIDAKNNISAVRDVAIKDGRIAAVAANLDSAKAAKTVDVKGLYVTPGLVDIHVHVYTGTGVRRSYTGDWSVYPDGFTFRSGVTTVVDAGSSGWRNFPDFLDRVIERSKTRVLAFINIVGNGMAGAVEHDLSDMQARPAATVAMQFPEHIVGFKTAHYSGPEWRPVEQAVEAGKMANLPVIVDFGVFDPARPHQELVLQKLRPGDIYTHTFLQRVPMLDEQGKVRDYLFQAQKRGVFFDVGHGGGSFIFRYAVPAIKQGFLPDSISTDLHITSMNAGMKDMTNVMSKFLNMGMTMDQVIERSTWNPAKEIKREETLGHLSPGAVADISVLSLQEGNFGFVDVSGARLRGNKKLVAELTLKDGRVEWDLNGITSEDWDKLPKDYSSRREGRRNATGQRRR